MADLWRKLRGRRDSVLCPLCLSHPDSQEEGFRSCTYIKEQLDITGQYENIFEESIDKHLTRTILKISSQFLIIFTLSNQVL